MKSIQAFSGWLVCLLLAVSPNIWTAQAAVSVGGGSGGTGVQTPWASDENAANHVLTGSGGIVFSNNAAVLPGNGSTNAMGAFAPNGTLAGAITTNGNQIFLSQLLANVNNASIGAEAYLSDVITPVGAGSQVWYDGTSWRLQGYNIKATADIPTFILNCVEAAQIFQCRAGDFHIAPEQNGPTSGLGVAGVRFAQQNGTGAGSGTLVINATYGAYSSITPGTAANGWANTIGLQVPAMAAGNYFGQGGNYYVTAASVTADSYWCLVGMMGATTTNFPAEGAFFVYDQQTNNNPINTYVAGLVGVAKAATNNWICCTAAGSSYTFKDTGYPVAINTASTPNRLGIIYTNGAALFYTNGVLSQTITTTLSSAQLYIWNMEIVKPTGTTSRSLAENAPWRFVRHPIRTYP
jgi:hypothetical protein